MGRGAEAYNFLAVKITIQEVRSWLTANVKDYSDSDYGSTDQDHFEIIDEWAGYHDVSMGKFGVFSSVNYEDDSINGLYYGVKLNEVYLHASADGWTSVEEYGIVSIVKHAATLGNQFPKKTIKLVTIQTVG